MTYKAAEYIPLEIRKQLLELDFQPTPKAERIGEPSDEPMPISEHGCLLASAITLGGRDPAEWAPDMYARWPSAGEVLRAFEELGWVTGEESDDLYGSVWQLARDFDKGNLLDRAALQIALGLEAPDEQQ